MWLVQVLGEDVEGLGPGEMGCYDCDMALTGRSVFSQAKALGRGARTTATGHVCSGSVPHLIIFKLPIISERHFIITRLNWRSSVLELQSQVDAQVFCELPIAIADGDFCDV